jgi:hypothetical protein
LTAGKVNAIETGSAQAQAIAAGVALARDLVNMPPNVATPTKLAETAESIAHAHNFNITVGDRAWAAERNMGGFLAVAKGAGEPPKFIVLEHNGDRDDLDTIVLVGKGITFDTGGISIKPSERMEAMKSDMGGAAAVLGAMKRGRGIEPAAAGHRHCPMHGKYARRQRLPPGRRDHRQQRRDHRNHLHRRRGAHGAGRRAGLRHALQPQSGHRPGDADGGLCGGPGAGHGGGPVQHG